VYGGRVVHAGKIKALAEQPMLQAAPIFGNPTSTGCRTGAGIKHLHRVPALFKKTPHQVPRAF